MFHVFSYQNELQRRSARVVYDNGTQEFMLRLKIGLTEFCDVQFIHCDRHSFESTLKANLLPRLETLQQCIPERMESLFRSKKILEWFCEKELLQSISGFELYLCPKTCVQTTNGSYLILDYADFSQNSSLRFYYNVFRDDFYAEYLVQGAPQATQRFDAKTLPELEEKIRQGLVDAIAELRLRLATEQAARSKSFERRD